VRAQIENDNDNFSATMRTRWTGVILLVFPVIGILLAGATKATGMAGGSADRCTAFSAPSTVKNGDVSVQWQFRVCTADAGKAAQLRFQNNGGKPLSFNFRLFTDGRHGCGTASDVSSLLTGSAQLTATGATVWPYPTVRLPDEEYKGRLWLCVFEGQ
jgi:hypothetical protein